MSSNFYGAIALTGGAAGALDAIDGTDLATGDGAYVITATGFYIYYLNASSGAAESSPDVISPDDNAGNKRWILQASAKFYIPDTDSSNNLQLKWNEDDATNRILNFKVNTGNRTLDLAEDLTVLDGAAIKFYAASLASLSLPASGSVATLSKVTIDIDGGSIDGTPIGAATKATGNFSYVDIDGGVINATTATIGTATITTADINGGTVDGVEINDSVIGASTRATGNFSYVDIDGGVINASVATIGTVDINGGNIDGTPIGMTTRATGNFSYVDIDGGTANIAIATLGTATIATLSAVSPTFTGSVRMVLAAGSPFIAGGTDIATLSGVSISNANPSVLTKDATIDDGLAVNDAVIVNSGANTTVGSYIVKSIVANTSVTLDRRAATGTCDDGNITYVNDPSLMVTPATVFTRQIAFPATAVPSADPNTLDDYEEGTWTPAIAFGGAAVNVTYGSQVGAYTKIGNTVYFTCRLTLTSNGDSTGNVQIAGFPFTSDATNYIMVPMSVRVSVTIADYPWARLAINSSGVTLYSATTILTQVEIDDAADIYLSGHYRI